MNNNVLKNCNQISNIKYQISNNQIIKYQITIVLKETPEPNVQEYN